ncbi:MAG TPA: sigma-54 dependent transcriptional regulator [Terriglobia bacterium]|nr:sigma-54 dependent transcriptional regulator [Terriglobia bacterium]
MEQASPFKPEAPWWVGEDPASDRLRQTAAKLAQTHSSLLIRGESGTGKDLFADIIHFLAPHRSEPLLKVDCASLPETLVESELFGYEPGAFTGASEAKCGRLELAGHGTLVLDEIAALTPAMQSKLLRVVDQRSFERLGGHTVRSLDARIMALTSADLERKVREGSFREDLYFRLNVVPVLLPPLRERRGDIRPLAEHFCRRLSRTYTSRAAGLTPETLAHLERYDFPGNTRELRNIIERAMVEAEGAQIEPRHLPAELARAGGRNGAGKPTLEEVEKQYIEEILRLTRGRKSEAATILGISRKTLLDKRKRYHLD